MRGLLVGIGLALVLGVGACLIWPGPIDSRRFDAPPAPAFEGVLAPNRDLDACEVAGANAIDGPEELELDAQGRVYAGTRDGRIVRLDPRDGSIEVYARPGGGPNGLSFDRDGALLVADGFEAPSSIVDPAGGVRATDRITGGDTTVGRDGTVYLSHLPDWERTGHVFTDFALHLLEAAGEGELRAWDPETDRVRVLARGLHVPDGVALSADEDFVAVGEVGAYRISRVWLRGPRAGTVDRLIENLPGHPDGLVADGRGTFWVALPMLRSELLDFLHRHPFWKDQAAKLLLWLGPRLGAPPSAPGSLVLAVDESGHIVRALHERAGVVGAGITTAFPDGDRLYIGSLMGRGIGVCPL